MKLKNIHCARKKNKKIKKKKSVFLNKTLQFPSLLLCHAVIRVRNMKVAQFQKKNYYIVPGREFFTTSNIYIYIKLELRINLNA